ncbi:MAG: VTT domain-containing protein [Chloroflexota bacterium]
MSSPLTHLREGRKRIIETVLWGIAMLLLSIFIVFLIRQVEIFLKASPESIQRFAPLVYVAVFVIALLNSATIIIPAPGIALIIALATQWNPVIVAVTASIGSSLGEMSGYLAGRVGTRLIAAEHMRGYQMATRWVKRHGWWMITVFAFVPLVVFDIVGLVGGGLRIPAPRFLLATWLGRLPRSFIEIYAGASIVRLIFPQWF